MSSMAIYITTFFVGFLHVILGPDHYIPFVAMARAGKWSIKKTMLITLISGIGHVLSSIVIAFIGVAIGFSLTRINLVESVRGEIAIWILIIFGLLYTLWGIKKIWSKKHHHHFHEDRIESITPWVIFTVFVFGPCEPLIPLVVYPAARGDFSGVLWLSLIFSIATIGTMLVIVRVLLMGVNLLKVGNREKYVPVISGSIIMLTGIIIKVFNL